MRIRVKFYIAAVILILILQVINVKAFDGNVAIQRNGKIEYDESLWNDIIAESINDKTIKLSIDGKVIPKKDYNIYLGEDREFMIEAKDLTALFQCAYGFYAEDKIVIEKGTTRIVTGIGKDGAHINEGYINMKAAVDMQEGKLYIPLQLVFEGLGYAYTFDINENSIAMVNTKSNEPSLPTSYDYRTDGRLSSIKNQGKHSTCWAFASLAALESSIMPDRTMDYSEKNMTLNNGYKVSLMSGGDYTMAMSYLAAWLGPIPEYEEEGYGEYETPTSIAADIHVQEIQLIGGKDLESIKKAVFLYAAVESSLYMAIDANNLTSYYYNKNTASYCYIGTKRPNHDVVIIGWDDNYSKDNFNFEPEGNGAFICQNSWGEGFGDGGIFYVSYYDSNIGMHNVVYTGVESRDNYDNIYQSDICGFVGQLGYESEEAYFANVYTARGDELLEAISFYATDKNTEYEIYVVENFEGKMSFNNRRYLQKGSFVNAGYYTVKLDEAVELSKGTKYAVIVKIKTPNAIHPIAIEYAADYETSMVDITDGEGYISFLGKSWERVEETKDCNICLKMFTSNIEED